MTFEDTLARWLPRQRWYSGKELPIHDLSITADVTLVDGDPGLRHLIVSATQGDHVGTYQLLAGFRSRLPASLSQAVIGPAGGGMTAYDALHDPELASVLLRGIAAQRQAGPLRFVREPGAAIDDWPDTRVLGIEQSNTSVVFGEAAILKLLRRPFPGRNPDLEVAGALWRLGSSRVAAPLGWIETTIGGEQALLAVLSRYLPHASDGWSLAVSGLRDLYGRDRVLAGISVTENSKTNSTRQNGYSGHHLTGDGTRAGRLAGGWIREEAADPHFTGEAYLLGRATAEMHADLAAAFGAGPMPADALAALAARMTRGLEQASAEVPELGRHAAKLRASYCDIARIRGPVPVQRVHGDFHLGQVLRTQDGWVALDFEGEPAVPLAQRRARYPALKDVAGMLRSFDYAARHQLLGHPDEDRLRPVAEVWVERCQAAFCAGYAHAGGMDPLANAALMRALMLEKAVYEVVYEARHRPAWMSIPLESIAAA
jgi:maltokinase